MLSIPKAELADAALSPRVGAGLPFLPQGLDRRPAAGHVRVTPSPSALLFNRLLAIALLVIALLLSGAEPARADAVKRGQYGSAPGGEAGHGKLVVRLSQMGIRTQSQVQATETGVTDVVRRVARIAAAKA